MARDRKKSPWLKEKSDRSGFDNFSYDGKTWHKKWVGVKDKNLNVAPEEYDTPPPSSIPLGGADISGTPRTGALTTDIPSVSTPVIQYLTAGIAISLNAQPWIMVVGSNQEVNITADPQIVAGQAQQQITIQCVGSAVILENSNGLALIAGKPFRMGSGAIIDLYYSRTDNLWHEISRVENGGI